MQRFFRDILLKFGLSKGPTIETVFDRGSPLLMQRLFTPRSELTKAISNVLHRPSYQLLLHGEKNVGKSEIALRCSKDYLAPLDMGGSIIRVQCSPGMSTNNLLAHLLQELGVFNERQSESELQEESDVSNSIRIGPLRGAIGDKTRQSTRIIAAPWIDKPTIDRIAKASLQSTRVMLIDDLDDVLASKLSECLSSLCRLLYDSKKPRLCQPSKLVVVVTTTDIELLDRLFSPRRNGFQVIEVNRMSDDEIRCLVTLSFDIVLMRASPRVVNDIVALSGGMPEKAKELCLEAGVAWAEALGLGDHRFRGDEPELSEAWFADNVLGRR